MQRKSPLSLKRPRSRSDDDTVAPTISSFELAHRLPNAQISMFPDAGHGRIFQCQPVFVERALNFLR
jgi:pimeloyl-ACP methyl ester carboxylesterase